MCGTTSRKCTDEIGTCERLQAESVQMRLEHVRDYNQKCTHVTSRKCTDEIRTCENKQKVYR